MCGRCQGWCVVCPVCGSPAFWSAAVSLWGCPVCLWLGQASPRCWSADHTPAADTPVIVGGE